MLYTEAMILQAAGDAYLNGDVKFDIITDNSALIVVDLQDEFVKPGWTSSWEPARITAARLNFDKFGTCYKIADEVLIEKELIFDVSCYWLRKKEMKPGNRIIIYLHGGCFVLGSIHSHQALVSHIARELEIPVLFVEYRLAPEHPFPAAVDDLLKVYNHIIEGNQNPDIILMGDSAGAGLAMSVISILNKINTRKPQFQVMISPWVDLRVSNKSIETNAGNDPVLTKGQLDSFTSLYLGNTELSAANPIGTIFGDFPPTLILVGSREILSGDSELAYSKIKEKQPATKLKVYNDQTHVWLLDDIRSEASKDAIEEIRNFIDHPLK